MFCIRILISSVLAANSEEISKSMNKQFGAAIFNRADIQIEYNVIYNAIKIRRSLTGKFLTDKDAIISDCRRSFNIILCYDIYYHMFPLKIHFE